MTAPDQHIQYLLKRWYDNTITPLEKQELAALLDDQQLPDNALHFLQRSWEEQTPLHIFSQEETDAMVDKILQQSPSQQEAVPLRRHYWKWAAAAAVIIAAGTMIWLATVRIAQPVVVATNSGTQKQPASASTNKVTLELEDGSALLLDSSTNGVIRKGIKQEGNQLQYEATGNHSALTYNTLTTPRGKQFQLQLPDGTHVWLNAASSVRYPTNFDGKERLIQTTGEVYFEVAPDAGKPFRVQTINNVEIAVLGTSFNINAYSEQPYVSTTLLEGSVMVRSASQQEMLRPGQQANIRQSSISIRNQVETEQVVAWKKGLFNFEDAGIADVMHQLERWYDIEVIYEKGIPDIYFTGKMSRDLQLTEILEGLKGARVNCRLEGKRLIVMP